MTSLRPRPQQQATTPPAKATALVTTATTGEIKSIHLGADGKVDSVIARVGGFLGIGTKGSLKAMPDYKYERRQPAAPARSGG